MKTTALSKEGFDLKIGILTIGNELTSGRIRDTNSSFIAEAVNRQGWRVSVIMSAGDEYADIRKGLDYILDAADAAIVTGGLGPTADDITTEAVAKAYGLALYTDEDVLREVRSRLELLRVAWTPNNAKQAMFPEGAMPIHNPTGTAWGFALKRADKLIAVIPGVPREVERMLPEGVIPLLKEMETGPRTVVVGRTIKLFGLSEAKVDQTVSGLDLGFEGLSIGFYPRFPENHLVLTVRSPSEEEARKTLSDVESKVEGALRKYIFGHDDDTIEGIVASLLTRKRLTLAVAESCTGGLIMDRLTDVPGSSLFLERGYVVYSNKSKTDLLDVPAEVIDRFGAVSEETARLMAEGAVKKAGTDLGVGVTGIAGPTGGTEAKPVGTVYIALADRKKTTCRLFHFRGERRRVKEISARWVLEMLRRYLTGAYPHD